MPRPTKRDQLRAERLTSYWERTRWPLQSLYFLLPLLIGYELGMFFYTPRDEAGVPLRITAERMMHEFFNWFGVTGYLLPGLLVIAALLGWHFVRGDPWKPEPRIYFFMLLEAIVYALPLYIFVIILFREPAAGVAQGGGDGEAIMLRSLFAQFGDALSGISAQSGGGTGGIDPHEIAEPLNRAAQAAPAQLEWRSEILFAIGAGIYEELMFRLIGIAALHALLVSLLALPEKYGAAGAVIISALAFSAYHFTTRDFAWGEFGFYTLAGIYFAGIYVGRGFGIVAATHAVYDLLWVTTAYLQGRAT